MIELLIKEITKKFVLGERVEHTRHLDKLVRRGKIVAVHDDDGLQHHIYYTVCFENGNECQTLGQNLVKYSPQRFSPQQYLIFTSVGDFHPPQWKGGLPNTDIIVYFHGNNQEIYKKYLPLATFVVRTANTNFKENFNHFKTRNKTLFNHYKRVMLRG